MTFDDLNLHPLILKALKEAGYSVPTDIQSQAIPEILEGSDLRASAQTGTGKTAAFLLPALNRLATPAEKTGSGPRVVILAPTRELAMQITEQAEKYSKYLPRAKTVCVFGGVPYHQQMRKLSRPYDILVATPGRLIDYINRRKVDFSRTEMLILDEADRMLDMGFQEPVEEIVRATPSTRQTLLFSATLDGSVVKLSNRFLKQPKEVRVAAKHKTHDNITQSLHYVDNIGHKNRLLNHVLRGDDVEYAIVFTSTKRHADQLVHQLYDEGHEVAALHGDMNQRQRTRTIAQLKNGKVKILVATDVAARGIDVNTITHVINFDLPRNVEDYVHRIGRTGRAGATGIALSFAAGADGALVRKIEQFTKHQIDVIEIAGFEPRTKPSFAPSKNRPGRFNRGGNKGPNRKGGHYRSNRNGEQRSSGYGPKRGGGQDSNRGGFAPKRGDGQDSNRSGFGPKRGGGQDSNRSGFGPKRGSSQDSNRSGYGPKRSGGQDSNRGGFAPKRGSGQGPKGRGKPPFGGGVRRRQKSRV